MLAYMMMMMIMIKYQNLWMIYFLFANLIPWIEQDIDWAMFSSGKTH